MNTVRAKVGDKVTVVNELCGHEFEIGSEVECVSVNDYNGLFSDGGKQWFMRPSEYEIVTPTTPRAAHPTPPQCYVIFIGTEAVITTRSEAEDLVASGCVTAVYKLGDKVGVTTTVTLED